MTFSVAANTGASREGTLTVAGQAVTVTQAGNCTVTPSPLDFSIAAAGATGRVVTVSAGGGCGWTATSNASWLTITAGASGSGGGSVTFSVAANTGGGRSGTLTVAGQAVTITQAGNCTLTASPLAFSVTATGATGQTVTVARRNRLRLDRQQQRPLAHDHIGGERQRGGIGSLQCRGEYGWGEKRHVDCRWSSRDRVSIRALFVYRDSAQSLGPGCRRPR